MVQENLEDRISDIEAYRRMRRSDKDARDKKSGIATATIDREVTILRSIFPRAVEWKFLAMNPCDRVRDLDSDDPKRERFLSNDEIHRLLRATKRSRSPLLRPIVFLALRTGMRKGELLVLTWDDILFDAGKILVTDSKSGSARHVPMDRRARWLLSKMPARNPLGGG